MKLRYSILLVPLFLTVACGGAPRPPAQVPPSTPVLAPATYTSTPAASASNVITAPAATSTPVPVDTRSFFNRADLLYSSSIGSWMMQDGRYDGQYMLNYHGSCPGCVQLALQAQIPVVSWAIWDTFSDQINPSGRAGTMTTTQFINVISGIRNTLGAYPFIKLQPNNNANSFCPETWGISNLLTMNKEAIRTAGNLVQLYEIANEPDLDCGYATTVAGSTIGQYWIQMAPQLKKYARSLGFEIYIGGPSITTTNISNQTDTADLQMVHDFLQRIKDEYNNTTSLYYHDKDLIPSFVTFHNYGIEYVNIVGGDSTPLDAIPYYGAFIDTVQSYIKGIWGNVVPSMKIAISEWNIAAESYSFPEALTSSYYTKYLQMLRQHHVFMAMQFLMASNNNNMDMITEQGMATPAYNAFATAARSDRIAIQSRTTLADSTSIPPTPAPITPP